MRGIVLLHYTSVQSFVCTGQAVHSHKWWGTIQIKPILMRHIPLGCAGHSESLSVCRVGNYRLDQNFDCLLGSWFFLTFFPQPWPLQLPHLLRALMQLLLNPKRLHSHLSNWPKKRWQLLTSGQARMRRLLPRRTDSECCRSRYCHVSHLSIDIFRRMHGDSANLWVHSTFSEILKSYIQ